MNLFRYFVFLVALSATSLMADWSTPAVVYTAGTPDYAVFPFIATNASGKSVAVWFDLTDSGSLQGATLDLDGGGDSWVATSAVAGANVSAATNTDAQAVGIDSDGNAMAVWTDGTNVYVSILSSGSSTWGGPTTIGTARGGDTITNPYIAVAENGNAVVAWVSASAPYEGPTYANVYNSGSWLGETQLSGTGVQFNAYTNPVVAVDPIGDALLATTIDIAYGSQIFSYTVGSGWTSIPQIAQDSPIYMAAAMDSSGNATVVWTQGDDTTYAATLAYGASTITNKTLLSSSVDTDDSPPSVIVDSSGNAIAVWTDASGDLASASYSFTDATWSSIPLLDLGGNIATDIALSGNATGNAVASWTVVYGDTSYIQTARFGAGGDSWQSLTTISPTSDTDSNSQVSVTPDGNAVVLWQDGTAGTINSSYYLTLFGPLPPSYFVGQVVLNRFLTQTDRVHQMSWGASTDDTVVSYTLSRNSVVLSTRSAGSSTYSYEDHNRSQSVSDTYTVVSVNGDELDSVELSVTLQ